MALQRASTGSWESRYPGTNVELYRIARCTPSGALWHMDMDHNNEGRRQGDVAILDSLAFLVLPLPSSGRGRRTNAPFVV